jgi:hypothetical protein
MTPAGASVFILSLTLVFVGSLMWWALRVDRRSKSEPRWPTVEGLVSHSEVIAGKTLKPRIVYSYSFNGQEYIGKVIQSNMVHYSGAKTPRLLCERFPVGSHPTVYVDGSNPKRAVLIPGGDRRFLYFVFALAAFFLATSAFMAAMMHVNPPR